MDSEIEALPQLRFPLREALLSLHDSVNEPPSVRTALAGSASLATLGPYKVSSTEKSRALKKIGRLKRRGEHIGRGYAEERPLHTPRPPPESERPKTVPKSVPSAVSRKKARLWQDTNVCIMQYTSICYGQCQPVSTCFNTFQLQHVSTKRVFNSFPSTCSLAAILESLCQVLLILLTQRAPLQKGYVFVRHLSGEGC